MANPDASGQVAGRADKPGVHIVVRGPCFAAGPGNTGGTFARAPLDHLGHNRAKPLRGLRCQRLFSRRLGPGCDPAVTIAHPGDADRRMKQAFIGNGCVGGCHFQYGYRGCAQGECQVCFQRGCDTHFFGGGDNSVRPCCLHQPNGDHVAGLDQRLAQRQCRRIFVFKVSWLPAPRFSAGQGEWLIAEHSSRCDAALKGCCIENGFKGRAGLPVCLHRPVVLVFIEISAACHGPDPAACAIKGNQRSLRCRLSRVSYGHSGHAVLDSTRRLFLHNAVHGGGHCQSFFVQIGLGIFAEQLIADVESEIAVKGFTPVTGQLQPLIVGGPGRIIGNQAILGHPVEDIALSGPGRLGLSERRIVAWRLGQAGQQGYFPQIQLRRFFTEIGSGRRLHAVGPFAEIDFIEIDEQDIFLAQQPLKTKGKDRFGGLAQITFFTGEQQGAGNLLGDGRPALAASAGAEVVESGPGNRPSVQAGMLPEAAVLGGDKGGRQKRRHGCYRDDYPEFPGNGIDGAVVAIQHQGGDLGMVIMDRADIGQRGKPGQHQAKQQGGCCCGGQQYGDQRSLIKDPARFGPGGRVGESRIRGVGGQEDEETVVLVRKIRYNRTRSLLLRRVTAERLKTLPAGKVTMLLSFHHP